MTKRVEIYLRYPRTLEMLDLGAFKELFLDAYNVFENRDMRSLKNTLEAALEIDLTEILTECFLELFKQKGLPPKTSGYWKDEDTVKIQGYLQSTYFFNNLFGFNLPEALNILIEADYNIDTDPEYGWVLYA